MADDKITKAIGAIKEAENKKQSAPSEETEHETGYFEPLIEAPEIPLNETSIMAPSPSYDRELCGKNMELLESRLGREFDNKFSDFKTDIFDRISKLAEKIPNEWALLGKSVGAICAIAGLIWFIFFLIGKS